MSLKLKTRALFPAHVTAESPLIIEKNGVVYEFSLDADALTASLGAVYQPIDQTLTALAALNSTAGLLTQTGADTFTKTVPGTGVLTALGINIGSAGAFVTFNGAGGTPSSITLTNGTGLPVTSLTGTGTGVLAALQINVGSAGAPVLFNGAGGTPSSITLTNGTGLPLGSITGFGTGGATFLGTPSSANLRSFLTDETGTGPAVFGTNPQITKPDIVGTVAVDNANAGSVGEYPSSIIASGSAISLATNTAKNLTSLSLTAGDWDVWAMFNFITAASTNITQLIGSISLTTDTSSLLGDRCAFTSYGSGGVVPGALNCGSPMVRTRINVSSTTTVYAVAQASFTIAGLTVWGSLQARRVR